MEECLGVALIVAEYSRDCCRQDFYFFKYCADEWKVFNHAARLS